MEAAGLDPEKYAFYCKNVQYFMPDGTQVEAEEVNPPTAETVPDDYTKYGVFRDSKEYDSTLHEHLQRQNISNSQRYKMLGNGWTVDVISHIMKGMEV